MRKPVAMITGASRGIGRGIAIELAKQGYDIIGTATKLTPEDRDKGLFEVKDRVESYAVNFVPVAGDIADPEARKRLLQEAFSAFGRVDVLVNNAGVGLLKRLDILETTEESYDRVMNINLKGPFFLTQAVANQMIRQVKQGTEYAPSVIFITSISSHTASPNRAEYCVSKAGISMMTKLYADRLAEYGIGVFEISPGIIATDMTSVVKDKYDKLIAEGLTPIKRWGQPEDIAKAVGAIAEGRLDFSTGQVINVDGGFHLRRL